MPLSWSTAGFLSLFFTAPIVLVLVRLFGWNGDPLDLVLYVTISQVIGLIFGFILVLGLKIQARKPN